MADSQSALIMTTYVTATATVVVAVATVVYASLVKKQVRLGEPRVIAYVATQNSRPRVDVTNAGGSTAYEVSIRIDWPPPPGGEGSGYVAESPTYGRLAPEEVRHFLSPHDFNIADYAHDGAAYMAKVHISYAATGDGKRRSGTCNVDFAEYIRNMRQAVEVHP